MWKIRQIFDGEYGRSSKIDEQTADKYNIYMLFTENQERYSRR